METCYKSSSGEEGQVPVYFDHELRKTFAIPLCLPSLLAMVAIRHQAQKVLPHSEGVTPRSKCPYAGKEGSVYVKRLGCGSGFRLYLVHVVYLHRV